MADLFYNRTKKCFKLIDVKKIINRLDFNIKECCDPFKVFGNGSEGYMNDFTSAWFKLQTISDNVTFVLKDSEGNNTIYQPERKRCLNDSLGYVSTINWINVLNSDGSGCYTFEVNFDIDGNTGSFIWGVYDLKEFSIDRVKGSVRVLSVFNQYFKSDNIDLTNMNLVDTVRFNGFFGNSQPNYEIDNLILQNRSIENIQRESIKTFELNSDAVKEAFTKLLIDVHFLLENEIYISDFNEMNHDQYLKEVPLIVKESPEIDYLELSKFAKFKVILQEKKRNKLANYNGG